MRCFTISVCQQSVCTFRKISVYHLIGLRLILSSSRISVRSLLVISFRMMLVILFSGDTLVDVFTSFYLYILIFVVLWVMYGLYVFLRHFQQHFSYIRLSVYCWSKSMYLEKTTYLSQVTYTMYQSSIKIAQPGLGIDLYSSIDNHWMHKTMGKYRPDYK